ncbi:bacterial exopeptidase dimerization domain-containing protein [Exidia glandulosa HHB12029]|uniref:Bacterial exopeptidase dimerization domain-containing protein n=1 Tax=Exidia glandulosa HHB12029 TaxID=1314781 RepID=A0A165NT50_EXIGL|nr:bacterial exopeptidase dimerization domain-containing protein [Exidia glandulosa HHB12029]
MAGVGVALGIKAAMEDHDIDGKVILLGTPAEEGGAGKIHLLNSGAYDEMDVCLMSHPSVGPPKEAATSRSLAVQSVEVEFHGHTAHAGAQPWEGQNALDAAVLTYNAVSVLRQQIKPDHRIHGIIEGKDWAPNIIPDYAKMRWLVRAPNSAEVEILRDRLLNCIKAASMATSCTVDTTQGLIMKDLRQNDTLGQEFATAMEKYGYKTHVGPSVPISTASTDFGNITYALPSIHPRYGITQVPGAGNHTAAFTKEAATQQAHHASLAIIKGLAMTGVRVLTDAQFFEKAKREFESSV